MALLLMDSMKLHATVADMNRRWSVAPSLTSSISVKGRSGTALLIRGNATTNYLAHVFPPTVGLGTNPFRMIFDIHFDSGLVPAGRVLTLLSGERALTETNTAYLLLLSLNASGQLVLSQASGTNLATSSVSLLPDVTYQIEIEMNNPASTAAGFFKLWVDGILVINHTGGNINLGDGVGVVRFTGALPTDATRGTHYSNFIFWDSLAGVAPTTSPLGVTVVEYVPSTDTNLDELVSDGDTTSVTVSATTTFQFADITDNADQILAAQPVVNVKSTGTFPRQFNMKPSSGGTVFTPSVSAAPLSAYDLRVGTAFAPGTPAALNALQLEIELI